MSYSGTLRHAQGGIEPAVLRLPDDLPPEPLLLKYIITYVDGFISVDLSRGLAENTNTTVLYLIRCII